MVLTSDIKLPTDEDLKAEEIPLSMAALVAGSNFIGHQCEALNNEFMLCRHENPSDPRPCLDLGVLVTKCSRDALMTIKQRCAHEFTQFANCIDKSSGDYRIHYCRKTQEAFYTCLRLNTCVVMPDFGHFTRARIHKSGCLEAPPQQPCPCKPKVDDPTPSLPDDKPRKDPRFTSRLYYVTE